MLILTVLFMISECMWIIEEKSIMSVQCSVTAHLCMCVRSLYWISSTFGEPIHWPCSIYYGRLSAIAGRRPLCFTAVVYILVFLFLPLNLRSCWAGCHQTLSHVQWWPRFIKFGQKFGWPLPPTFGSQKHQNLGNFATWSQISPERNKTSSVRKQRCKLQTLPHRQT